MLSIHVDTSIIERGLRGFEGRIKKAIEIAINRTAKDAKLAAIGSLGRTFTIRNGWVANRIRLQPAKPGNLVAVIGSKDAFMEVQAVGGSRPRAGAVPTEAVRGPGGKGLATRDKWPGALAKKKRLGYFLAAGKGGAMKLFRKTDPPEPRIRRRAGHAGPVLPRYPIAVIYHFPREAQIKPRWPLEEIVRRVVATVWPKYAMMVVRKAIELAIAHGGNNIGVR